MEKAEIEYRIKSLILYSDSVERSDMPIEMKQDKLNEIEKEKIFLENILEDRKFKAFMKEFLIGMGLLILASTVLLFIVIFYGS
jgi:hypothetical protein